MYISKSIIKNIGEEVIKQFLRLNKVEKELIDSGQDLEYLLGDLSDSGIIQKTSLDKFFFNELMYGKRRQIRVYNLKTYTGILYSEDWMGPLSQAFNIDSLEFNNICSCVPNLDDRIKIAAINTDYDSRMEIRNISIIFCCYIEVKNIGATFCYIPVCFDIENRLLTIKTWNRQNIMDDERFKQKALVDEIVQWLENNLQYSVSSRSFKYKAILYNMNISLVKELLDKTPVYKRASILEDDINNFADVVLDKLDLENKKRRKNGDWILPQGVMDVKDELWKLIQRLSVADYFMERDYEEVWDMGISAIVNRVRFNAIDNVLAIISGTEKRKPVFCSNSFLVLLKSIEESHTVDSIWISFRYDKRTIRVCYNASNPDYFEIYNLSSSNRFTKDEFAYIWEVLMRYES